MSITRVEVVGSHKDPLDDARAAGPVDGAELAEVTVRLRAKPEADLGRDLDALLAQPAKQRKFLDHAQLEAKYGASDDDLERVEAFAEENRLSVVRRDAAHRSVVLRGTLGALQVAFGTHLERFHHATGSFRGRTGAITVPAALGPIIVGVYGLDTRPLRKTRRRVSHAASQSFTGHDLAQRYKFPQDMTGAGECIAFIELGGGFRRAEVQGYIKGLGLPAPRLSAISVNGAHNSPSTSDSDDGEVVLDMEAAGAAAPGARLAVYFADNTDRDFIDAIVQAVHDKVRKPSVISISWGGPESTWTIQSRSAMDDAFKAAALLGITVCVASGDHGTNDNEKGPAAVRVDYPASSPYVLGCGGTSIDGGKEAVWNEGNGWATGGGISAKYPVPAWQQAANKVHSLHGGGVGRGVPDVAGSATHYRLLIDGDSELDGGGTSAVAPLWAALIARLNQALGRRVGFINPAIYAATSKDAFIQIVGGDNAALGAPGYPATAGWNPCTGLGVPVGDVLKTKL